MDGLSQALRSKGAASGRIHRQCHAHKRRAERLVVARSLAADKPEAVMTDKPAAVVAEQPAAVVADKPEAITADTPAAEVVADKLQAAMADKPAAEVVADLPEAVTPAQPAAQTEAVTADKPAAEVAAGKPEGAAADKPAAEDGAGKPEAVMSVDVSSAKTPRREIVFVTSEVAPYSKTGGLGDVCGSLPKALAARGHRVMVVAPAYQEYQGVSYTGVNATCDDQTVGFYHTVNDGVDLVFVDHPSYKRPGGLYGDAFGTYGDNQWRFKLLCLAALEAPLRLPLGERGVYGQECIFVANDWFAGLVPVYLAARYRAFGIYLGARSVLAIHNLRHQGVFPPGTFADLDLPPEWNGCMEWQYPPHLRQGAYEEEGRAVNTIKAAISTADRIVTVSPGYAYEIQTALGGWGMEFLLGGRKYVLNGILNGIDHTDWDPSGDVHLQNHFSMEDMSGKARCKAELQKELGLPVREDVPLIAFIGRLDYQKGADLLLEAAPWIADQGAQLVCLGSGDAGLEDGLRWLEATYHDKARGWVGFNVPFSHRLTAGADMLLMPSRFEPCGLNQLYAMRYGTVPIAHATGGLRDTVIPYDVDQPDGTTGFVFSPCGVNELKGAIWNALQLFRHNKGAWRGLMKRGMERDCTWDKAAEQYEQIFTWAKTDLPYTG